MPTAILGGSFNPAHGGHRQISLAAAQALGLAEVWWLVSPGNPLKAAAGMAPLTARLHSARLQARRAPVRVSAIETRLGTRFTADTLRLLVRRYPRRRFVWLMGSDNLAQFHRWRAWRRIARIVAIAVVERPGSGTAARRAPAALWLRRWEVSAAHARKKGFAPTPMLVLLRFDPDPRSATALRLARPHWASPLANRAFRDQLTREMVQPVTKAAPSADSPSLLPAGPDRALPSSPAQQAQETRCRP